MRRVKTKLKILLASAALVSLPEAGWTTIDHYSWILSNNVSAAGSIRIGKATWTNPAGQVIWQPAPTTNYPYSLPQKTLAADKSGVWILYRDPGSGVDIIFNEGTLVAGTGAAQPLPSGNAVEMGDGTFFTKVAEEIETNPDSHDVFALVTSNGNMQVYRIDMISHVATPMTIYVNGVPNRNSDVIFESKLFNGYKAGSIAFIPDPTANGSLLAFTHQSTHYGLCTWTFKVNGNRLESRPALNHCSQAAVALLGNGTGINTVYIEGTLVIAHDNAPLQQLDWNATTPISPLPVAQPITGLSGDFAPWSN